MRRLTLKSATPTFCLTRDMPTIIKIDKEVCHKLITLEKRILLRKPGPLLARCPEIQENKPTVKRRLLVLTKTLSSKHLKEIKLKLELLLVTYVINFSII